MITDNPEAHEYNIIAYRNEDFVRTWLWMNEEEEPIDISDFNVWFKARKFYPETKLDPASVGPLVVDISESDDIAVDGPNGEIAIDLDQAVIYDIISDVYNYQLIAESADRSYLITWGIFEVRDESE